MFAIAGTAIYLATRKPKNTDILDTTITDMEPVRSSTGNSSSSGSSSGFPLSKGSRGTLVQNIQEALIKKYGASILPRYGADGVWGTEMQTALIAKGLPTSITADLFKQIVTDSAGGDGGTSSAPTKTKKKFKPALLAKNLRLAILDDDLSSALRSLSKIWTVKGYTMVNTEFKKVRIGGVRKTIVNALLTKFWNSSEKKKLNAEFSRMGLKYDGSKWSLSGFGQILTDQIQSLKKTKVWNAQGKKIIVPKNTILGEFLDAEKGVAKFKTLDDKILYVNTNSISYV